MQDMPDKPTEAVAHTDEALPMRQCTPSNPPRRKGTPPGWTGVPGISRTARLRLLGNSVVVNQAAGALTELLQQHAASDRS